ncbi:hypothetical protein OHC33_001609 [Knufia fluminis]|uniref:Uncharacterized protein n=1 Tax=Knufia fluminis TaxID=191047 RepID=A0AAN8ERS4_9EURO|nr:hypothetical protein OHC33_001609 [Knufia fluminis]
MPFRDIFSELEDYVRDRGTHAVWQGPNFNVLVSKRLVEKVLRNLPPDSANREPFKAHYAKFFDPKARHAENLDRDLHGKVLLELLETRDVNARSTFHLLMDEVGLDIGFHVYGLFRGYRNLELRLAEKPAEEGTATQTPLIDAVRLIHQIGDPPVFTQVPDEPVERRFRCMLRDCAKPITSVSIYQLRNHLHKHHQYSWDEINSISKENNNEALWKRFGPFSKQELEDSGYEMRNFKSRQSGFPTKAQDPQQEGTGEDETNHPFEEEQAESPDLRQSSRIQRRNRPQVDETQDIETDPLQAEANTTSLQNTSKFSPTGDRNQRSYNQDEQKAQHVQPGHKSSGRKQSKARSKNRANTDKKEDLSQATDKEHDQEPQATRFGRSSS